MRVGQWLSPAALVTPGALGQLDRGANQMHLTTLRHASPVRNLPSIFARGLQPARSLGRLAGIWLHARSRSPWAVAHVAARHGVPAAAVVVLSVRVPRAWLSRRARGSWVCPRVIPPSCFVSVLHPAAVA
jgi:hypothetical protein